MPCSCQKGQQQPTGTNAARTAAVQRATAAVKTTSTSSSTKQSGQTQTFSLQKRDGSTQTFGSRLEYLAALQRDH